MNPARLIVRFLPSLINLSRCFSQSDIWGKTKKLKLHSFIVQPAQIYKEKDKGAVRAWQLMG